MPEHDRLRRLAARLARDHPINWDAEEHAASTEEERRALQQLQNVAAMAALHHIIQSDEVGEDLSASLRSAGSVAERGAPPQELAPGSRWGQLEIIERIGRGAFGDVYRARDVRLDREVALKMLVRDSPDPLVEGEAVREARLLARINHPNVVTVYGADRIDGRVGIWMEYLSGETLDRISKERGALDPRAAALIGIDISRALAAVHAAGIAHRDVKLSNVMRVAGGRIVLTDFGLGREAEPGGRRKRSRTRSGTPLFMAPEVLKGGREGTRSDLYSLGVVLFALVTGHLPVEASSFSELLAKHERGEARRARDLVPSLPIAFARVLDRALAPDPADRFVTAEDVVPALVQCVGSTTAHARAAIGVPHRLPGEMDAFVGREKELGELGDRLDRGERLVTVTGAGGMGKTRLVVHHGWQNLEEWPGGVWFCDLTEARSLAGIALAVAESLGVPLGMGDPVEQLGHAIAARGRSLFILDNFEQIVARAEETVARWITRAAEARFIVTSRERLNLDGEDVQRVEPLSIEPGMELFVERARRQNPGFEPEGPEADAVRDVVGLVEGMPLAIELAAARMRVMTAGQMVGRMRDRFRVLGGPGGGRHSTLRAAIDDSWELLSPWEKAAWAQCAVFEGGFTLEAAEGVLDSGTWDEAPWFVDVVQSLVDKSLLRTWTLEREAGAGQHEVCFGMLVSLQEYAREKLAEEGAIPDGGSGAAAALAAEERHGRWYARYGTDEEIEALYGREGVERRRKLGREIENLRAACRRAAARGDGTTASATYRATWEVLGLRGPFAPAIEVGQELLAVPQSDADRAAVLLTLAQAESYSGRLEASRAHYGMALALARERDDRRSEGVILDGLTVLDREQGRLAEAQSQAEAALLIHRETGNRRREGSTLGYLGVLSYERERMDEALARYDAALAIDREVGNRRHEGDILGNLGIIRMMQGRRDEARTLYEAALAIHREVGNRRSAGLFLGNLGIVHAEEGRMDEARTHFEAALAIDREVGNRRHEGIVLGNLGMLLAQQGSVEEARAHHEAALAIHREVGDRRTEAIARANLDSLPRSGGAAG